MKLNFERVLSILIWVIFICGLTLISSYLLGKTFDETLPTVTAGIVAAIMAHFTTQEEDE